MEAFIILENIKASFVGKRLDFIVQTSYLPERITFCWN
jgi:hypothetical protein